MNDITTAEQLRQQGAGTVQPGSPGRAGSQSTMVEQTRAAAEVFGAIRVAREYPRSEPTAYAKMREACGSQRLAERAFFRFNRGGVVSGESVHLARELARCWGNILYGVKELGRDDVRGVSEMLAFAWDLETNARAENAFIVPHKRDKKGGPADLVDMRDIYENNANMGARRLRECIFAMLPPELKETAKAICLATLEDGGGKPLALRIADMTKVFEGLNVTRAMIEKRMGRTLEALTPVDVAQLGVVFNSIKRGEIAKEEEFPEDVTARTTAALRQTAEPTPAARAEPTPTVETKPATVATPAAQPAAATEPPKAELKLEPKPAAETKPAAEKKPEPKKPAASAKTMDQQSRDQLVEAIEKCATLDDVVTVMAINAPVISELARNDPDSYGAVQNAATARKAAVSG